jgi:hypothetical protein
MLLLTTGANQSVYRESDMTDDQFASDPTHKAAMVVRAVICGIADVPDVACDLSLRDIDDLKLAHARLGDLLFSRLRLQAA